jgi:hypothetical protein
MYDAQIQPLNGGCVKVQSSFSTHFVTILNTIIRLCILTFLVMMNLLFIFASVGSTRGTAQTGIYFPTLSSLPLA